MPDQLITALCSSLAGGMIAITGILLTNRSNTTRLKIQLDHDAVHRKAQVLRDRGEELYVLMEKWLNAFTGHNLSVLRVMQGKITYNESSDLDIEALGKNVAEFSRIELLVDIYYAVTRKASELVKSFETPAGIIY